MQELYDSDYKFNTAPGTSIWDSFKYGNTLWQRIYKEKLEPFEKEYKFNNEEGPVEQMIKFMLVNKHAYYVHYPPIAWVGFRFILIIVSQLF